MFTWVLFSSHAKMLGYFRLHEPRKVSQKFRNNISASQNCIFPFFNSYISVLNGKLRVLEYSIPLKAPFSQKTWKVPILVDICLFKVSKGYIRLMCEICSKLAIKTPERHHWRHSGVFIVNFQQTSHIALV